MVTALCLTIWILIVLRFNVVSHGYCLVPHHMDIDCVKV